MAIVLSGGILVYAHYEEQMHSLISKVEVHARIASANSSLALVNKDKRAATELLHSLSIEPTISGAIIYDLTQNNFASYYRNNEASQNYKNFYSATFFKIYSPITHNGVEIGGLVLLASKNNLYIGFFEHITIIILIFFITAILAYFYSIRLQEYISKPINHLVSAAKNISINNDYTVRVDKYFDDELGMLTDNFNLMLEQIHKRDISLENEVENRTQELKEKNIRLTNEVDNRVRVQNQLLESEKKFRSTFANAAIAMMLVDRSGYVTQANKAVYNILGYDEGELIGKTFMDITYDEDIKKSAEERRKLINGELEFYRLQKRLIRKDGEIIWGLQTVSGVFDEVGNFLYAISQIIDMTEETRLSNELSYQASHDVLTGLINRREFEKRVHEAWRIAHSGVDMHILCFIDLDQFKVINDTCGHVAGDEMLRQIALILQQSMRKGDSVARLGGDEFGILMQHCSLKNGMDVIESLRKQIETFQFIWDDNRFKVAASIGLVQIDAASSGVVELLKQADTACFGAKEDGRNRINIFSSDDEVMSQRRGEMQWLNRIQGAIDENRLLLNAQPIVPINLDEHGLHVELLVRLISEQGEIVQPGSFLPAAERYGISPQIDHWVINHVFKWMNKNNEFVVNNINTIAINLSGLTLSDEKFLDDLIDSIFNFDVPAEKLCFEITETALVANLTKARKFIQALRRLGCKFSLDDFGSGLSSFAYLKNLQVDYLKIDGMFVRDILNDPVDYALVKSIHEMGRVMGKRTIAEFVENNEILEKVKEIGVDYAQGYGVGEVVALHDLTNYSVRHEEKIIREKLRIVK